jgi:hypothetical protein
MMATAQELEEQARRYFRIKPTAPPKPPAPVDLPRRFTRGDLVCMRTPSARVWGVVVTVRTCRLVVYVGHLRFGFWHFDGYGRPVDSFEDFCPEMRVDFTYKDPFQ